MITAGENSILKIIAICEDGTILPPCGRCRELIYQIDHGNLERTEIVLSATRTVKLKELLPYPWNEAWNQ
jgi:cytidine deaminase